jgi:radical SAM superfamily enzyme YgiQ (UPF0313 family)
MVAFSLKAPSARRKVGLVQINNSFSGQSYLPYAVCLLQAYYEAHGRRSGETQFLIPIFSRMKIEDACEKLADADIVLFSTYVWNVRISCAIAKQLKALKPGVKIIFGGPQVPDYAEDFLKQNDFIDVVVHGEGEQVVASLLDNLDSKEWRTTPGISFLHYGQFVSHPKPPRIKDMEEIPSPYLTGKFREVMEANPDQKWIALWETNRGCPFSCTYCDWGSTTQSRVYQFGLERLYREVEWFAEQRIDFVFCCDANYGILPRDLEITNYVAEIKTRTNFPKALSVQNTKNATERAYAVQKKLSDAGLNKGVTLAIQSMDKQTLKNIKRENISLGSYQELQRRFTRDRVETYSDYILGLPGETYDATVDGIATLIENGQHNRIQFNNLSILPNAEMGKPEYQAKFGMVAVEADIINIHGSLSDADNDIPERQQLVIATSAMPREDWVRTRAFCWFTALTHFDKILQIPIIITNQIAGIPYREILEKFVSADVSSYPVLGKVREFFIKTARDIQSGGPEYVHSAKYLDIFWPADELILIELIASGEINEFYDESSRLLVELAGPESSSIHPIIAEAVKLNRNLLKTPFSSEDTVVECNYNIFEFYKSVLINEEIPLENKPVAYQINKSAQVYTNWDDFCREVIWYGNKKGAYLYTNKTVEPEIAGIY